MSQIQPEIGFIGFFDILGYSQIMLNNNIHQTSQFVSDTLMNIPKDLIGRLRNIEVSEEGQRVRPYNAEEWQRLLDKIQWIIFSDSILISMPMSPGLDTLSQTNLYLVFSTVCASLLNQTFTAGFPIRGGISIGEFFIEDRCFAGRPIINAYRVAQDLEMSGCVLDESADTFVSDLRRQLVQNQHTEALSKLDQTTILYIAPTKVGEDERFRAINWVTLDSPGFQAIDENVRDATLKAFLMHNKIAVPSVQGKIVNTEMFIRHVLTNLHAWI
jgi:hypothetical protein